MGAESIQRTWRLGTQVLLEVHWGVMDACPGAELLAASVHTWRPRWNQLATPFAPAAVISRFSSSCWKHPDTDNPAAS
ncbi:hypothetical protein KC19_5G166700 [Ceratodon purpureus]|uniref:Uncharacterized protein n=1 Tax=Ceratodon purpureus TaxID=3225 RepID=A0A8T0I399_CERPU|nr:hypothetical protein KC19_5G166700 [Ceratodon purpureus]